MGHAARRAPRAVRRHLDFRQPVTVAFDGDLLTQWTFGSTSPAIGTAQGTDVGNDGALWWGRWHDGVTGTFEAGTKTYGPHDGLHYVVARKPTDPTAEATEVYDVLLAATTPTADDESLVPGDGGVPYVDGASVTLAPAVDAGTTAAFVALSATVHLQDGDVTIATDASPAAGTGFVTANGLFNATTTITGSACVPSCGGAIRGVVSEDPRRVGFVYVITRSGQSPVRGAVALAPSP